MKITRQQEKAVMKLFTARGWPQRIGAIAVLGAAMFGWWQHDAVKPGQLSKGMQLQGQVIDVADGDTVTVRDAAKHQYKLRLAYIDAPEKAMPYGPEATKSLTQLLASQDVVVEVDDVDRYGRGVARIFKDGKDINYQQISKGYAWHYAQYAKKSQADSEFRRYQKAQEQARSKQQGLWRQSKPREPWEWRAEKREEN